MIKPDNMLENTQLRKHLLATEHGSADSQRREIVSAILRAFREPQQWPTTDAERITLLRDLYSKAVWADQTERA